MKYDRKCGPETIMRKNLATFRFYEELNDFLHEHLRKTDISYQFYGQPAVKDAIEAMGIPHTEVDLIIANGQSVDFKYPLTEGDHVSVYPEFESLEISPIIRLRPEPLRDPKFILDVHLGKLARLMRLAGLDTLYRNDYADDAIVRIALREKRIILTMDRHLLKRRTVTHGIWIRSRRSEEQLVEIIKRLDLLAQIHPFSRCLQCNTKIQPADKESIRHRLQPRTLKEMDAFTLCPQCDKIYWRGSHYDRMKRRLEIWIEACKDPAFGKL